MNYRELKEFLETLTSEQLEQPAVVFESEDEQGKFIDSHEVSDEDFYWEHHGDCIGNLDEVKSQFGEKWEEEIDDLIKVPAGMVSLHLL